MSQTATKAPTPITQEKPAENGKSVLDKILDADQRKLTSQLRETAGLCVQAIEQAANHLEKTFIISDGIRKLKALLTDAVMDQFIMPLQNSPLGFLTDRKELYPREVVRECAVATFLAGLRLVDNEVNIIAGRVMPVLNGWRRKTKELAGVTDAEVMTGTAFAEGGVAKVVVSARAKKDGILVQLLNHEGKPGRTIHIPIKSPQYDTVDTWRGKAERRAWKALFERLNGGVSSVLDEEQEETGAEAKPETPTAPPPSKSEQIAASLGVSPDNPPAHPPTSEADLDAADRSAAIAAFRARIPGCTTETGLGELAADLVRNRTSFGDDAADGLGVEIQARREALKAKEAVAGKPKKF